MRLLIGSILVLITIFTLEAKANQVITVIDNIQHRRISLEYLIKDDEELLSLTDIAKVFKALSQWNPISKKITLTKDKDSIAFNIGSALVQINNQTILMDRPAELITGRVFIPVKFIKDKFPQVFEVVVSWDKKNKKLTIDNKEFTPSVSLSNQPTIAEYFPLSSTRPTEEPGKELPSNTKTESLISGTITEKFSIKTIIIDPGHGGHDPGAIGNGIHEKDVVLDMAKRLRQLLINELPEVKIILTREGDYFVPLRERTGFANYKKADLFISIHANASYSKEATGFEVYYLSPDASASDESSRALAVIENKVLDIERREKTSKGEIDYTELILGGLAQQEFIDESIELAGIIQNTVCQRLHLENRKIKSAFFWVIKDAMMPAVLIETGFISNPYEAQKLNSEDFKNEMGEAICQAIIEYKSLYDKKIRGK